MIDPSDRELTADIETAVRAIPGVTAIFRPGSLVSKTVDAAARSIGVRDRSEPLIGIDWSPDGAQVEVAISVDDAAGSVETSRRVHAAIGAVCTARGITPGKTSVTVVHIGDTTSAKGPSR